MTTAPLRHLFVRNLWLKGLSVALAAATWLYVSEKTNTEEPLPVPLVLKAPAEQFILDQTSSEIRVTLRGPSSLMNQLQPESLRIEVDVAARLKDRTPDTSRAPQPVPLEIRPSDVRNLPRGVSVIRLDQRSVTITLDQMSKKPLAVRVERTGDLPEGLEIHRISPTPSQVMVRGPKSVLAQLDSIRTEPVPIGQLKAGVWQPPLPLDTRASFNGRVLNCLVPDPAKVDVWIEIIPLREKAVVKNVSVELRGLPGLHYALLTADKTKAVTELAQVEVRGTKKALEQPKLRAFVDVTDVKNPREQPEIVRKVQFTADPDIEVLTPPPDVVVQIRAETP